MTEISRYWEGTVTGDPGPYTTDVFHAIWKTLFTQNDNEGVIEDFLNVLVVSGVSGGVQVVSGAALVDGSFYKSDATVSVTIPTPSSDPRIDRIVLQKDWVNQTIRIARIAGTEAGSPTPPALTQTSGSIWEIPLAQILITTAGVITVTDEREFGRIPLVPIGPGLQHIETQIADGTTTSFDFQDIPQTFRHLELEIQGRFSSTSEANRFKLLNMRFNGDSGNNYNTIGVVGQEATDSAQSVINFPFFAVALFPLPAAPANFAGSSRIFIANYKDTTLFKTVTPLYGGFHTGGTFDSSVVIAADIWRNTDAITSIFLTSSPSALIASGSQVSLYGMV